MREAIDQFHREAVRSPCTGLNSGATGQPGGVAGQPQQQAGQVPVEPRIKVIISDRTIFGVDDPDRFSTRFADVGRRG